MLQPTVLVLCLVFSVDCARILAVFPTPSISHQLPFRPFTQELAKRGHEVVVITTDPAFPKGEAPENLREIDVHDISYALWGEFLEGAQGEKKKLISHFMTGLTLILKIFMKQLATDEVQQLIQNKNETFDLLFLEACARPALIFSHLYKIPTIQISSFSVSYGNFEVIGAPVHIFLYPLSMRQWSYNLTFNEKLIEFQKYYHFESSYSSLEDAENEAISEMFGSDVPSIGELKNNVQMLFLNVHPIWDGNRPMPPSVVFMGGVHKIPEKNLPKELDAYLSSSKHGVIYISFGTNVNPSLLPRQKIQSMIDVVSKLPYDVLWKWDEEEMPGRTKNIRIAKWLPQSDLLRHPKIKLFITQGGLQSTDEAILAGVPLVGIPMLVDQWYNAEKYVQLGMGLRVDMETLTADVLRGAVEMVINDEGYRRNVLKFRSLMYDQKERPLDRVVWWTEHVLRHGGAAHLRSPIANISWAEFLQLDVVSVLITGLLGTISFAGLVLYFIYSKVR